VATVATVAAVGLADSGASKELRNWKLVYLLGAQKWLCSGIHLGFGYLGGHVMKMG